MSVHSDPAAMLRQFQEITGLHDDGKCLAFLANSDWNLEMAVHQALEPGFDLEAAAQPQRHGGPTEAESQLRRRLAPVASPAPAAAPAAAAAAGDDDDNGERTASPRRSGGAPSVFGYVMQFVSAPFRLLFAFLATLVPGLSTLLGLQPALPARSIAGLLDELCGPGKYPALIEGSHVEALQAARRQAKFLLIYLHEDNNESAREFCRRVLTDEALVAFVNVNMLFWAADTRTAIGSRAARELQARGFPFLGMAIFAEERYRLIFKSERAVPQPLLLLEQINAVASQFEAALVAQQADREGERARASEAQRLREEQDAALQASLRADQEKEKQRLEAERREREAAEAERRKAEEVEQAARALAMERQACRERLLPEPAVGEDAVRIAVKMPDGSRLDRRFPPAATVSDLYDFVFGSSELEKFLLHTASLPKREVSRSHDTLEAVGLSPKALLLCQDLLA